MWHIANNLTEFLCLFVVVFSYVRGLCLHKEWYLLEDKCNISWWPLLLTEAYLEKGIDKLRLLFLWDVIAKACFFYIVFCLTAGKSVFIRTL